MIWQSADKSDVLTCYMMSVQISIHIDIASYSYVYTCEPRLEVICYFMYILGLNNTIIYESEALSSVILNQYINTVKPVLTTT